MRPALIVLTLLGLMGAINPSLAAPLNRAPAAAPSQSQRPNPAPAEDNDDDDARPEAARGNTQPKVARASERRRITYASCNRESHRQNLRGGARRRFLIRCKLGLEKRKSAPQRQGEPTPAGKRP